MPYKCHIFIFSSYYLNYRSRRCFWQRTNGWRIEAALCMCFFIRTFDIFVLLCWLDFALINNYVRIMLKEFYWWCSILHSIKTNPSRARMVIPYIRIVITSFNTKFCSVVYRFIDVRIHLEKCLSIKKYWKVAFLVSFQIHALVAVLLF